MTPDALSKRAKSFERGAAEYEQFRPEFPADVFGAIEDHAGERLFGRVLEVGAGTGRATLPLVRLGAVIHVVEPSKEMLGVLEDRLRATGTDESVNLQPATFEDVDPESQYDVVIAAQSFHWADPSTRWSRLASLIRPDGVAFLLWNGWQLDPAAHNVAAIRHIYDAHGDGLEPDLEDNRSDTAWAEGGIDAHPEIRLLAHDQYEWPWELDVTDYLALLVTTSQYAVAPTAVRDRLFDRLGAALGERVALRGRTMLLTVSHSDAGEN